VLVTLITTYNQKQPSNQNNIGYNNKEHVIHTFLSTQLLHIIINNTLLWKNYIDKLMGKLSKACYTTEAVKPFITQE
jgi:hypothetical protein